MDTCVTHVQRVYLLDDHDLLRRELCGLVGRSADLDVVGDSGTVRGAASEILRADADVMLLDLHLLDGTGIEVCRAVRSANPCVSGLLLTASNEDEALAAAVLAGASGYLVKLSPTGDIPGTIRSLRPGSSLLDARSVQWASTLLGSIADSLTPAVTDHQRRVLAAIVAGQTDSQIADGLQTDAPGSITEVQELVARMTRSLFRDAGALGLRGYVGIASSR